MKPFLFLVPKKYAFVAATLFAMTLLAMTLLAMPQIAVALPDCPDRDAKAASDDLALGYFRQKGEIFYPAKVLKRHHPSRHKEVASYVRYEAKHYSIFSLVSEDCDARFIKRTRQGD